MDNTPDPTRTHAHFLVSVSHRTHAHSAWLKLFKVKLSASSSLCFTSISFLDVVTQHHSLSVPACFILHHPDLQHPQRPRSCRNSPSASARWSGSGRMANPVPKTKLRAQALQLLQLHGHSAHADLFLRQPPRFPEPR